MKVLTNLLTQFPFKKYENYGTTIKIIVVFPSPVWRLRNVLRIWDFKRQTPCYWLSLEGFLRRGGLLMLPERWCQHDSLKHLILFETCVLCVQQFYHKYDFLLIYNYNTVQTGAGSDFMNYTLILNSPY